VAQGRVSFAGGSLGKSSFLNVSRAGPFGKKHLPGNVSNTRRLKVGWIGLVAMDPTGNKIKWRDRAGRVADCNVFPAHFGAILRVLSLPRAIRIIGLLL